jgi:hypothetical protein
MGSSAANANEFLFIFYAVYVQQPPVHALHHRSTFVFEKPSAA